MSLDATIRTTLGSLRMDLELPVSDGEVLAVVGPNGSGKTTLLRVLAGLVPLDSGRVVLDDTVMEDTELGRSLPPEARPVGFLFQDYLLFPHLSALENVAFGLRARGTRRPEARRRAQEWLDRVGLGDQAASRPSALSGGQRQRVALARALAVRPRLLLLDEPLAAVDLSAKPELRRNLRAAIANFDGVRLVVTHDPLEAASLADRVVVLESGKISQIGDVAEVTTRPRSGWAADMLGVNLYEGHAHGGQVAVQRVANGRPGGDPTATLTVASPTEGDVFVVVHPRAVTLYRRQPEASARNIWEGAARTLDLQGDRARITVDGPLPVVAEVTAAAVAELHLADGGPLWVSIKATEVVVYPV